MEKIKLISDSFDLISEKSEYKDMIISITNNLPEIKKEFKYFGKTQSQFMDNFFTVSHPTPLRNARQILAEINRICDALKEAQYNLKKNEIEIKKLYRKLKNTIDDLEIEELELEISFKNTSINDSEMYIQGAIRSLVNYTDQYKTIIYSNGYDKMSEKDFEKEEEKYHIMKAFDQAICAARSRSGFIDEGNHIYFSQIGINGAIAQHYISLFFEQEQQAISSGGHLDASYLHGFLSQMALTFSGCSDKVSELKGMNRNTDLAILK